MHNWFKFDRPCLTGSWHVVSTSTWTNRWMDRQTDRQTDNGMMTIHFNQNRAKWKHYQTRYSSLLIIQEYFLTTKTYLREVWVKRHNHKWPLFPLFPSHGVHTLEGRKTEMNIDNRKSKVNFSEELGTISIPEITIQTSAHSSKHIQLHEKILLLCHTDCNGDVWCWFPC